MEGDAVAAETALTSSGRGRSADFLEYFRVCFENGDLRDFDRWRFGSQKYYAPDYYKIGYLTVAGMGLGPHGEFFDNTLRPRFHGFAREMQQYVPRVILSVVDCIDSDEIEDCCKICADIGAEYRVRIYGT